ncbi:hypothetical protein NHX12_023936 [Muraenolepis orangiensis]|uniref:Uncharacterized protein n=1 Tax=Muraenolepis orangiensis TaxID=630683 RepID=A0A9Q0IT70_9TELE|nr:hypothetical protein NHX12_023936 [Muraenolepis orangiensis]
MTRDPRSWAHKHGSPGRQIDIIGAVDIIDNHINILGGGRPRGRRLLGLNRPTCRRFFSRLIPDKRTDQNKDHFIINTTGSCVELSSFTRLWGLN